MSLSIHLQQNARDFLRELDEEARFNMPKAKIGNRADHAKWLQFRAGYIVIDDALLQIFLDSEIRRILSFNRPLDYRWGRWALEKATDRFFERQIAFTGEMRPPVRAGGPQRPAHRGGWADVTTELASSYWRRIGNAWKTYPYSGKRYDR